MVPLEKILLRMSEPLKAIPLRLYGDNIPARIEIRGEVLYD